MSTWRSVPPTLNENNVPAWQNDEDVDRCATCGREFTFFIRKHHCRKCGRIICATCSPVSTTYLPNTYVVSPPSQIFLESPHVPHRTCKECFAEIEMIREALRDENPPAESTVSDDMKEPSDRETTMDLGLSTDTLPANVQIPNQTTIRNTGDTSSEDNLCPVCALDLTEMSEVDRVSHVNECLTKQEFSGSPQTLRQHNRMLVYTIPAAADVKGLALNEDNECVICFEEFRPGDKIGRLECLCCFHYHCIKDWINHKGVCECPVHTIHYD